MLLVNDERTSVPDKFRNSFVKPVIYELHESQVTTRRDGKGNLIRMFPRSIGIDPFFNYFDRKLNKLVTLRFAENQQPRKIGGITQMDYYPTILEFRAITNQNASIICDPDNAKDIELHYFLFNHPRREESPNKDEKKSSIFVLQDLAANATKDMSKRKMKNQIENKILDEWSPIELEEMARSFGDAAASSKTVNEHRKFLMEIADKNPADFLKTATSEEMSLRAKIVDGINHKVLVYNEEERTWFWGTGTDRDAAEICVVRPGEDSKTRLIQFWNKAIKEDYIDYFEEKMKTAYEADAAEKEKRAAKRKGVPVE